MPPGPPYFVVDGTISIQNYLRMFTPNNKQYLVYQRKRQITIGHFRNVRGLGKSMVVFLFF